MFSSKVFELVKDVFDHVFVTMACVSGVFTPDVDELSQGR
jgi:hypothetical protein